MDINSCFLFALVICNDFLGVVFRLFFLLECCNNLMCCGFVFSVMTAFDLQLEEKNV